MDDKREEEASLLLGWMGESALGDSERDNAKAGQRTEHASWMGEKGEAEQNRNGFHAAHAVLSALYSGMLAAAAAAALS